MGRRVPVAARRLSACAKTFSSSRDAFIAIVLRNNLESQIQKPKFATRRKCEPAHALTCIA